LGKFEVIFEGDIDKEGQVVLTKIFEIANRKHHEYLAIFPTNITLLFKLPDLKPSIRFESPVHETETMISHEEHLRLIVSGYLTYQKT
jgi:hypothetical protein